MTAVAKPGRYDFGAGPIQDGRLFFPEKLSPLAFTPWLSRLSDDQRLLYNRLHACYFNEQLGFFEDALAQSVVRGALRAGAPAELAASLRRFAEEEAEHSAMFRRLNRLIEPGLYAGRDRFFVDVGWAARALLDAAASRPELFPLFIWVMFLQEERSLHYSRQIMRAQGCEPHFVEAYRLHMADEAGHVGLDEELLGLHWRGRPRWLRGLNARLLVWAMREFFNAPKRACLRVLDELGRRRPELAPRVPAMRSAMAALEREPAYHRTLYSREIVPRAFRMLDDWPELRVLSRALLGYEPRTPSSA